MIRIKINDHVCESEEGSTIIEVADRYGIPIPRFCYHSELSIAANCRMCLVEVSNSPRPVPACATPISDGLSVFTKSVKTQDSQKAVLEFLLVNHPLDCPVCDQGGECDLQDLTMKYGNDRSSYHEEKRQVANLNLGPLVATEMNRCIHCTRCVRFGTEIAGVREIGALGRGEDTRIANALHTNLRSSLSANIIDLCPVGALTSKPLRYQGRTWQYQSLESISYHDAGRARMLAHVFRGQIRRMVSQAIPNARDYWLTDRDRFGFLGMLSDRFNVPMIWQKGSWNPLSWNGLYERMNQLQEQYNHWAAWFHPMSTIEEKKSLEAYLARLHSPQGVFDLQHRKIDARNSPVESCLQAQHILMLGSFWESQQSVMLLHLRQWASFENRSLVQIGFIQEDLHIPSLSSHVVLPINWLETTKAWADSFKTKNRAVFINAQILNESHHRIEEIIKFLQTENIPYSVLGLEAPFCVEDLAYQSHQCMRPDVVVTLHLEASDWAQDKLIRTSIANAKSLINFSAMLPEKGLCEGQICVPIAAPGEYEGHYQSLWHAQPLHANALVSPPEKVLSFSTLIMQWLHEAPVVPHARPIPLSQQSSDEMRDIFREVSVAKAEGPMTLIVLKNPLSLNMILRRSSPLQDTPIAQESRGFWVGPNVVGMDQKNICIEDNLGQRYIDSIRIVDGLPTNIMLYWSGLKADEPAWGSSCTILHGEGI